MSTRNRLRMVAGGAPTAFAAFRTMGSTATACALAALLLMSCGKQSGDTDDSADSRSTLERIALEAQKKSSGADDAAVKEIIEVAGYEMRSSEEFPSQWAGVKGRMIIYAAKDGKSGGVIYGAAQEEQLSPVWHWFFGDDVPVSVEPVELNDDGLWDVRMTTSAGKTLTFIQDETFVMMKPTREDWIALNGASSPPSPADAAVWKCFDSDSSTAWRSPVAAGQPAYIEVPTPFGIEQGMLTVRTTDAGQPRHGTLYADGKKVQDFELVGRAANQMLQLEPAVKGARSIRLEFDSVHDGSGFVTVAELGIK